MNRISPKSAPHCLVGLLTGVLCAPGAFADTAILPLEDLQVFAETYVQIKRQYVESRDDRSLLEGAIRGLVEELDEYSAYLPPEDFSRLQTRAEGSLVGIGVEIMREETQVRVVSVLDDSPADEAGVQPGDHLLELDGEALSDWPLAKVAAQLRGRPGTWLRLSVLHELTQDPEELTIVRAPLRHGGVRGELLEGAIAYLRVAEFREPTADQLRLRLETLNQDLNLRGLVLDLRNNPGGRFPAALAVSDLFLSQGIIVSVHQRSAGAGEERTEYSAEPGAALAAEVPMVVLVDAGSASAAEIVAAALQDHKRATVIGTRTYGKGSVQLLIELSNGGGLKLTTAHFYTPQGHPIQGVGVTPDVRVESSGDDEDDAQLNEALAWIETHSPRPPVSAARGANAG